MGIYNTDENSLQKWGFKQKENYYLDYEKIQYVVPGFLICGMYWINFVDPELR